MAGSSWSLWLVMPEDRQNYEDHQRYRRSDQEPEQAGGGVAVVEGASAWVSENRAFRLKENA
jgi:hypothetical protein